MGNDMDTMDGKLLVATPSLMDPNFNRTVIFVVQHNDEGAMGVILNRPTETTIAQAWAQVSEQPCLADIPLYWGGPCQESLSAVHASGGDIPVLADAHYSLSAEKLEYLIETDQSPIRFFVGYAGWGPGQLEAEMTQSTWLAMSATAEDIFYEGGDLWERVTRKLAGSFLNVRHMPDDPREN
jgi:putative transcriptional regulator